KEVAANRLPIIPLWHCICCYRTYHGNGCPPWFLHFFWHIRSFIPYGCHHWWGNCGPDGCCRIDHPPHPQDCHRPHPDPCVICRLLCCFSCIGCRSDRNIYVDHL